MSKVAVVFGAGPGLGLAIARKFGLEGCRVALIARRRSSLDELVSRLDQEGIVSAGFPADLSNPEGVPALIDQIRDRFGRIDVVEYSPIGSGVSFVSASSMRAETLSNLIPLLLLTPVEIGNAVLPEMLERGEGAFLMTTGATAVKAIPHMCGPGTVMSAARSWIHALHAELADTGVYVGTLSVGAVILSSDSGDNEASDGTPALSVGEGLTTFPVVQADRLAEIYWEMYTSRDAVERMYPPVA